MLQVHCYSVEVLLKGVFFVCACVDFIKIELMFTDNKFTI